MTQISVTPSPRYTFQRNSLYYFRYTLPPDISKVVGKQGLRYSLKTGYIKQAERKARRLAGTAEFERAMIKERINAGLSRARAQGKKLGRPRVSLEVESKIRELRSMGRGIRKIAGQLRVGVSTVKRVVDEQKVA